MNKKIYYCLLIICKGLFASQNMLLAEVLFSINSDTTTYFVNTSDMWNAGPTGTLLSFEQQVIKYMWLAIADNKNIKTFLSAEKNYGEEYLHHLCEQKGMTREELSKLCLSMGFTLVDIVNEMNSNYLIQQTMETILSSIHVSEEEIVTYFQDNPQYTETEYVLVKGEKAGESIEWSKSYRIKKSELSEKFFDIDSYKAGDIVLTLQQNDKEVVYKLLEFFPSLQISLDDRYEEILYFLQNKKRQREIGSILLNVLDSEAVKFKYPQDYDKVRLYITTEFQNK